MELTLGLAFLAGIISFLSPCVLPLVPAYVGYMGGRLTKKVSAEGAVQPGAAQPLSARFSTGVHGLFFVAGFTLVFVSIGLLSTAFIQQVGGNNISVVTDIIGRSGGIVIVFFGLHFMGVMPKVFARLQASEVLDNALISLLIALLGSILIAWGFTGTVRVWDSPLWDIAIGVPIVAVTLLGGFWLWLVAGGAFTTPGAFWNNAITRLQTVLYSDTRQHADATGKGGYLGSGFMGVVFAAGWTPCIGPVYGAVLTLAASGGDIGEAGTMLTAYSFGLGIPFLLTALMLDSAQGVLRKLQRHMRKIELVSGAFLIVIGVTIAGGQLQDLSAQFADEFAEFSIGLEEDVLDLVQSDEDDGRAEAANNGPVYDLDNLDVGLDIGNLAPNFTSVTDAGQPVALADLRGEIVLLNFWATWCGPCRVEMPEFQTQFDKLGDDGFTILAVNFAESADTVAAFRAEFDLTFPLVLDEDGAINAQYGIFSYPSTLLVDQNGVIVAKHFGPLTADQIDELIAAVVSS